jgi:hypothetical protein
MNQSGNGSSVRMKLFPSARQLLDPTPHICRPVARFERKIVAEYGEFVHKEDSVSFATAKAISDLPKHNQTALVSKLGRRSSTYLKGVVGSELQASSRDEFLRALFSVPAQAPPNRLRHPFSLRRRVVEWRYLTATPMFYELNDGMTQVFNRLMKAATALAESPGRYFDIVEYQLETWDLRKRNAGAGGLIERQYLGISNCQPIRERLNVSVPAFHEAHRNVYFLPDAIAIKSGESATSYRYSEVKVRVFDKQFVTMSVPHGVTPVGYTWQYVNKNGGPDRRFNDNFQIPIIDVTELDFHFPDGQQVHTAFTDSRAVEAFESAMNEMAESS